MVQYNFKHTAKNGSEVLVRSSNLDMLVEVKKQDFDLEYKDFIPFEAIYDTVTIKYEADKVMLYIRLLSEYLPISGWA